MRAERDKRQKRRPYRATLALVGALLVAVLLGAAGARSALSAVAAGGPSAKFDWSLPDRFGLDRDGNGLIDYDYSQSYISPSAWSVNFDGCASSAGSSPIVRYTWDLAGLSTVTSSSCKLLHPPSVFPSLGTYKVTLIVTAEDGQTDSITQDVVIRDLLIVSIGDSVASGEGNPDKAQVFDALGVSPTEGPVWEDERCHRSAGAGPARAALAIEQADPKSSVTFLSYACSGAGIAAGLLGPYDGIEPPGGVHELLPPQVESLTRALCESALPDGGLPRCPNPGRHIDALLVNIGANDLGFSSIVEDCVISNCVTDDTVHSNVRSGLAKLPDLYDQLAQAIRNSGIPISGTYVTEYFNPLTDQDGSYCSILGGISPEESGWADTSVLRPLNDAVNQAALRNGWELVGGIYSDFYRHGYCAAAARWVRTEEDSRNIQGPYCCPRDSKGTLHPNPAGQGTYARRIVDHLTPRLLDHTPPTISLTSPAEGAAYTLGRAVSAAYSCADEAGGSGLASCTGTVASGSAFDTATVGQKSFTVTAADDAGNISSVTHHYQVVYDFGAGSGGGFAPPVDNSPTLNLVKAGSGVPVKFGLGGDQGLAILATGSPSSQQITCDASAPLDDLEQTVSAGSSSLTYDPTTGLYTYVWKTDKAWAGSCRQLDLLLVDGTDHAALFKFGK